MKLDESEYLEHYGILRKSGRYPWGSGQNSATPAQRSRTFLDIIDGHKRDGLSESEIAKLYSTKEHPFTTSDLRALKSRSVAIQKQEDIRTAQTLRDKGMSPSEIGRQMKRNESSVRSLLAPGRQAKLDVLQSTADMLKREVEAKGMIDVGAQVERDLPIFGDTPNVPISKDKFNTALSMLKEEGYQVHTFRGLQQGTGEYTKYKVLVKPGVTQKEAFVNRENIRLISEKTTDGGHSYENLAFKKPINVDPKRVAVRYKEEGGSDADGVIYVRPGKNDISLGKSHYSQVRIAVGGTHYLKGMAIYKDDLPPGVDLLFNTNKSSTGNKLDALKPLKKIPLKDAQGNAVKKDGKVVDSKEVDWNNPFGAFPKIDGGQLLDAHGNVTSAMNILNEQGDWSKWSRNLSSQVLSKQRPELAQSQLDLTYQRRLDEFDKLKALTNPKIKQKLLEGFADETDSAAVHLKAANMPRQATKVILPTPSLKPDEIFAPTFANGEKVALIRFPHAGRFEIPVLTVNNRNREARNLFKSDGKIQAPDAVGIHPKVAEHLSGADFDGDHVVVIPNNRGQIMHDPVLEGLKGFDPQKYKVPTPEEDPVNGWDTVKKDAQKQNEMGKVTNLISDMTIRGASREDLAHAVKHSMVVIDSEKHNLDFKASERDNNILALKKRYQGVNEKTGQVKGASTLITRATSETRVDKRKDAPAGPGVTRLSNATVDNKTGEKRFVRTGEVDSQGNVRRFRSRKLAETKDAFSLVSDHGGTEIEKIYAAHSNRLKQLANDARLATIAIKPTPYSESAKKVYSNEVASLNSKLNEALKNAPRERLAQAVAGGIVAQRRRANPDMEESEKKKIRAQALEEARVRTGAKKARIEITDREWDAIQAGAISNEKLKNILNNTDIEKLKERATPREKPVMNSVMTSRAQSMANSGYTHAEIADALNVPVSTLESVLNG